MRWKDLVREARDKFSKEHREPLPPSLSWFDVLWDVLYETVSAHQDDLVSILQEKPELYRREVTSTVFMDEPPTVKGVLATAVWEALWEELEPQLAGETE